MSLDLGGPVIVSGVADDLHRLAGNLIENALFHTPAGTPVTVSVRGEGGAAVLEVADRGPGVPSEMRDRVFERFARGGGDTAPAAAAASASRSCERSRPPTADTSSCSTPRPAVPALL